MNIRFDEPAWLWALAALAALAVSWWWLGRLPPSRRLGAILLRAAALAAIIVALARPQWLSTQASITVVAVLDTSGSIERFASITPEAMMERIFEAAQRKARDDRVGLVTLDARSRAVMTPTTTPRPIDGLERAASEGTALAEGIALARALIPADEAGRIVVLSDGLETIGQAASIADADRPGRVAIDTVLVPLVEIDDIAIDSFDLPAAALPRSTVSAMVALRASAAASGTLRIRMDDRSLTLEGDGAEGDGLRVQLDPGTTMIRIRLPIGDGPVHQLDAVFEPDEATRDRIPENSRARRVIAVPAGRSVLILGMSGEGRAGDRMLEEAGFTVRRMPADMLPEDPLWLAGFDLLLLDDVPAAMLPAWAQQLIVDHVPRLGGGLLATGGPNTFGAGGWRGSTVAALLPVEVEPPTEMRRPRAAVVFAIDRSGSMRQAVGGARATQQQVANEAAAMAIESIATRAFVGVIAFDNRASTIVPIAPLDDSAAAANRVRDIAPDGGTAIGTALRASLDALEGIGEVDQKLIVLLTDGMSPDREMVEEQTERAVRGKVAVTTISVGDATDDALLAEVAERTGGTFHAVRNPRVLPRVLVDSVQSINRPLIREGVIGIRAAGSTEAARLLRTAPALAGLVVLGPARSAEATIEAVADEEEPLLARWSAGVGRVCIFASEFDGPWSAAWSSWRGRAAFWEQLARWTARAPGSAPVSADAVIVEGRFRVTLEASAADAIDGAVVEGIARSPRGERRPFRLHRVAPRRFVGEIEADASGAWLAVLSPHGSAGPLPPMLAAAVAPEGVEFARSTADPAPLEALRRTTGGREIPLEDLAAQDLFSRDGLSLGQREHSLTAPLAALAVFLFLGDTMLRRLAVRRQMIAEALTVTRADSVVAAELSNRRRSTPDAGQRGRRSAGSATSAAVGTAMPAHAESATKSPSHGSRPAVTAGSAAATDSMKAPRAADPGPTAEDIRRSLAELRGEGAGDAAMAADESTESGGDSSDHAGDSTLEALRRARERSRIFPP